jgi:hypothetical protein
MLWLPTVPTVFRLSVMVCRGRTSNDERRRYRHGAGNSGGPIPRTFDSTGGTLAADALMPRQDSRVVQAEGVQHRSEPDAVALSFRRPAAGWGSGGRSQGVVMTAGTRPTDTSAISP